jgi:hypothetical protein
MVTRLPYVQRISTSGVWVSDELVMQFDSITLVTQRRQDVKIPAGQVQVETPSSKLWKPFIGIVISIGVIGLSVLATMIAIAAISVG